MRSQRATRHHYLGRLILATMATAIAISLGLTAFGTPVPASADESEVAASGANQSGGAELTNQQKADALKQAADAAEQANDIESATTLRGWANEAQNATGPADITTLSEFPLNPQAQVGGDAQPVGIRSFAFKKALKAVGWMIRKSPNAFIEVFSPDAFVEGEDDQGCGGDRGDGSGIEGDVLEGLEVLDQGVGPLGGSPH